MDWWQRVGMLGFCTMCFQNFTVVGRTEQRCPVESWFVLVFQNNKYRGCVARQSVTRSSDKVLYVRDKLCAYFWRCRIFKDTTVVENDLSVSTDYSQLWALALLKWTTAHFTGLGCAESVLLLEARAWSALLYASRSAVVCVTFTFKPLVRCGSTPIFSFKPKLRVNGLIYY